MAKRRKTAKDYSYYIAKEPHAKPNEEEISVARILVDAYRWKILFLEENICKGIRTPDFVVDNVYWEIKSPEKDGKNTLSHAMKAAAHQSENVIISLKRFQGQELKAIRRLESIFYYMNRIRHMKILTKLGGILDYRKK